jgi:hypothetical protein
MNPYLRAATVRQELRQQAVEALEQRLAEEPPQPWNMPATASVDTSATDPATPQDEAWALSE